MHEIRPCSECHWARVSHGRAAASVERRVESEGVREGLSEPEIACLKRSIAKVESWLENEALWRKNNPLEVRYGEDIPEAKRGWRAQLIADDGHDQTMRKQ